MPNENDPSQADRPHFSVNPYEASSLLENPSSAHFHRQGSGDHRHYQVRLDWSDRQALLRSVGLLRFITVVEALLWTKYIIQLFVWWAIFIRGDRLVGPTDVSDFVLGLTETANAVFVLWLLWRTWKYADTLRDMAGGTATTMNAWSHTLYRLQWLAVISVSISFATGILRFFVDAANAVL